MYKFLAVFISFIFAVSSYIQIVPKTLAQLC